MLPLTEFELSFSQAEQYILKTAVQSNILVLSSAKCLTGWFADPTLNSPGQVVPNSLFSSFSSYVITKPPQLCRNSRNYLSFKTKTLLYK